LIKQSYSGLLLKWLKTEHVHDVIILCVQTSILSWSKWITSLMVCFAWCMVGECTHKS